MLNKVMQIPDSNLFASSSLGKLSIIHDCREFSVIDSKGLKTHIQRADLNKELQGISSETLEKMLDIGYLHLNKRGSDYTLAYKGRVLGGGLFSAITIYVGTNVVGGAMILVGGLLVPVGGLGVGLMAAGTVVVTAAPATFLITLPVPLP